MLILNYSLNSKLLKNVLLAGATYSSSAATLASLEHVDSPSFADNQLLTAGDVITMFFPADLDFSLEKHASFAWVRGEVIAPHIYRSNSGETLRDLVQSVGGLSPHPNLYASLPRVYRCDVQSRSNSANRQSRCKGNSSSTVRMRPHKSARWGRINKHRSLCNRPRCEVLSDQTDWPRGSRYEA